MVRARSQLSDTIQRRGWRRDRNGGPCGLIAPRAAAGRLKAVSRGSANLYKVRVKSEREKLNASSAFRKQTTKPIRRCLTCPARKRGQRTPRFSVACWTLVHKWAWKCGLQCATAGATWNRRCIGDIDGLKDRLPTQFEKNTNRVIEEIDVIWLQGQTIVAAFEVEHSTSIFSGLLGTSDLLTMQPNITIKLYIVGPDERVTKFENEVVRPTFAARTRPLHSLCRFLPYSRLCERLEEAKNVIRFLRPGFSRRDRRAV